MSNGQAKHGGEIGLNGEEYKGGQFLPSSERTVKGAQNKPTIKAGSKAKIMPYLWGVVPDDNMLSIYSRIEHFISSNEGDCKFEKGVGHIGLVVAPSRYMMSITSIGIRDVDENFYAHIAALCEKFNAGERFFPLADDPFHYKNK